MLDHRPRAEVTAALEEALRVSLIVEAPGGFGRYAFGHALVREAIYRQQPRDDRLRLHLRAGRALEAKPPGGRNAAELALHFYHARGLEDAAERAVGYCTEAGHRAAESLAYEDAALQYGRALEAQPADADPVAT